MKPVSDISLPAGLRPRTKFIAEVGEECINMDGVIEIMRSIDTPQARRLYAAFRKCLAKFRADRPDLAGEKLRQEAVLRAIEDCGFRLNFRPVHGTMDEGA